MLYKIYIKKIFIILISLTIFISIPGVVNAGLFSSDLTKKFDNQETAFVQKTGMTFTESVGSIIATVIKAFLSLLGIIFVILIMVGGYNWMTAAGNEEKVTKAKETISRAVIGLIIVVSAYAITYFVFSNLGSVAGGGGGMGGS